MNDDGQNCNGDGYSQWRRDIALAAGLSVGAAVVTGVASVSLGSVGDREAMSLVEAVMPTSRFLCSAVMTSSSTILALMLTLIGMTISADVKFDEVFYRRLKQIAFYDMLTLIASVTFLLLHAVPITKSDQLPAWWYPAIYYSLVGVSAALGGALIGIVTMLYTAIRGVIDYVGIGKADHRLAAEEVCDDDPEPS